MKRWAKFLSGFHDLEEDLKKRELEGWVIFQILFNDYNHSGCWYIVAYREDGETDGS